MRKRKIRLDALMPRYSYFAVVFALLFNTVVYTGARAIAGGWHHYRIETAADRMIPFFAPSAAVYLGCYLFWAVNYILIARQSKEEVCRFFAADFLSRLVCLFFFFGVSHDQCTAGVGTGRFLESGDAVGVFRGCGG